MLTQKGRMSAALHSVTVEVFHRKCKYEIQWYLLTTTSKATAVIAMKKYHISQENWDPPPVISMQGVGLQFMKCDVYSLINS